MWDLGATYGAKLQNLRYEAPIASMSGPLTRKCMFGNVLMPFLSYMLRSIWPASADTLGSQHSYHPCPLFALPVTWLYAL